MNRFKRIYNVFDELKVYCNSDRVVIASNLDVRVRALE